MLKAVLSISVVLASTSTARAAGPTFQSFVADLVAAPADAAKRFANCDVLIMPNGEARRPCKLTVTDLAGTDTGVTLKATKVQKKKFPKSVLEWTEADVEVRVAKKLLATYHVFEFFSDEPSGGVFVQHWSKLVTDKNAVALAKANKLVTPKRPDGPLPPRSGIEGQHQRDRTQALEALYSWVTATGDIKETLAANAKQGAIVVGSAPGQRFAGARGSKTLAKWKMGLAWKGAPMTGGSPLVQWAYTEAVGTTTENTPTAIPYGAFAVQVNQKRGGGSMVQSPAIVVFSVPQ